VPQIVKYSTYYCACGDIKWINTGLLSFSGCHAGAIVLALSTSGNGVIKD
jgi:hypothetical protein